MSSKSKKQLAVEYGISPNTMAAWLKGVPGLNLNKKQRLLTPKQVIAVYRHLGDPNEGYFNPRN